MKKGFLVAVVFLVMLLLTGSVACASPDGAIKFGMRGDEVRVMQKMLIDTGFYAGEADGIFGNATMMAVKHFQESQGLEPDGVVGKDTYVFLQRSSTETSRYGRSIVVGASAYTAYDDGNSSYTYRGNRIHKGIVAVDPSVIPLGTRMYIPGYGYAIADDIGGAIKGNRIDLAFDNRNEALQFGYQKVTVYILD